MSYIDAILDRKSDRIQIAERVAGERRLLSVPANYVFYHEDPSGNHRSLYGHACRRVSTPSGTKFRASLKEQRDRGARIFESDLNPVFRYLADNYTGAEVPTMHVGFFDIEAAFHQERGYAPTNDPFNAITAISLYRSADQKLLTFVLRPLPVQVEHAHEIAAEFDNTLMFEDEKDLLRAFLDAIEDVDVLSGWNSSSYDVPYLVNRVKRLLGTNATRQFCLWDHVPKEREYMDKFGRNLATYDLIGRVHLDYLELYRKHNPQQRLSYALNAIGEAEVGEVKVPYEGTLDDLYNKELHKFIEYNRQDVMLMVKIDEKNKYLDLANQIAHANCVLLKTTMGSVALIEQAIINEMHAMGKVVPDRPARADEDIGGPDHGSDPVSEDDDDEQGAAEGPSPVVGAYVAQPKKGLHEHIGAVDINSLYPSAIRALNMSPETLVGQVRPTETTAFIEERAKALSATQRAEAWDGVFCTLEVQHMLDQDDAELTVDFIDNLTDQTTTVTMTGEELHEFVFNPQNCVCITAAGTLFRTDVEGQIPALLAKWYAERKEMQKASQELRNLAAEGLDIGSELAALLSSD